VTTYTGIRLREKYESMTASIKLWCRFTSEMVGGLPASREGLLAFAEFHLGIADPAEREQAVARILKEEVGEVEVTPEAGEVEEKSVYGVNVIHKTEGVGCWIGDWKLKAAIKQGASRVGIFMKTRGSKGGMSEVGQVRAIDYSLKEEEHPERIYIVQPDSDKPAATHFEPFRGRVQSPTGAKSIVHHSEVVEAGSRFAYEFRFMRREVTEEQIEQLLAVLGVVGTGSARSLERGKYNVEKAEVDLGAEPAKAKAKTAKAK